MSCAWRPARAPRAAPRWPFLLGWALALVPLLGLAELYLRLCPPRDLHAYLGEASPLTGPYRPDDDFGVTYRSWEAFCADNAERLQPFLPFHAGPDRRPVWAFFGNSFVQAPGMPAAHARQAVGDRRVFHLGRNELLPVRLAQIRLLLENGLAPERIFVELMPVDLLPLGQQPLATYQVTSRGALTYHPRLPGGPAGGLVRHSQVAFTAWARAGRHRGNPQFRSRSLYRRIDEPLLGDLRRLFAHLARVARAHRVPVTVLLIPAWHQVLQGASFGFQDTLAGMLRQQGYDVFDPRDAFCRHPDRPGLFLPDKHFTPVGNRLLLAGLLDHVRAPAALARSAPEAREP
jgi:hypothetical protein